MIATLVLLLCVDYFLSISPIFYLLVLIIWGVITLLGSSIIGWNYHVTSLCGNNEIKENQVSITFDDGPDANFTPQVLDLLDEFNAKATFFCIGQKIKEHPQLFTEIIKKGHTVGNHTYSHANNFGFFSSERVVSELTKTNEIAKEISGLSLKMFRPAFGVTNPRIKKALNTTGMLSLGWSKRSFDTTSLSEKSILQRVTKNLSKGDIILLHDSSSKSIQVLEQLLLFLKTNKLESVTIDQLLAIEPYA